MRFARGVVGLQCFLLCWALPSTARPATPRQELLRLVPEDVGFCLLIEDLRGHGTALLESPFVKQFLASPAAAKVAGAGETQKLNLLDRFLEQYLEVSAERLRKEILGDALVLAYRPGPLDKPTGEQGLFLIRARNARLLAELVERINKLQRAGGDLKQLDACTYAGKTYYRRVDVRNTNFYYLNGPILAFASQEGILRQVLDLDAGASRDTEPPLGRQFRLSGIDRPLAALWVNPRAFDAALNQKVETAQGLHSVALRTLRSYWQALDGIALSVALEQDFELALAVRARPESLPQPARRFLHVAGEPSELWKRFPNKSMFTVAGRTEVAALAEMLSEFLPAEARQQVRAAVDGTVGSIVGKDIVSELMPDLGPDWGFCAVAPPADEKAWVPHVLGALRVRSRSAAAPTDLSLLNALNSLATLAVFSQNGGQPGPLSLRSLLQDGVEVKYLVNEEKFPPGFQPAFAVKDGYLIVGSSPAALRRFGPASASTLRTPADGEFPLLRLSLSEVGRFIKERRDPLISHTATMHHVTHKEAAERLDGLLSALQFFDLLELTERADAGRVILTLRVRLSQSLR